LGHYSLQKVNDSPIDVVGTPASVAYAIALTMDQTGFS
jgi:hypothetical protein